MNTLREKFLKAIDIPDFYKGEFLRSHEAGFADGMSLENQRSRKLITALIDTVCEQREALEKYHHIAMLRNKDYPALGSVSFAEEALKATDERLSPWLENS